MASLPEPPPNVPRIVDVQDPGTGHYVVMVRMPTQLAAKFPDKAWGTAIDAIGLSKQDSDKFPGYTLVDVEPLKGSPDLYWIFQKLDGPVWETKSKETPDLTPGKYKRLLVTTKTKQEVAPGTAPDAVGTILDEDTGEKITSSIVQDEENTGKSVKVTTTETLDTNADPIVGQQFDPGGAIIDIAENVVPEGTQAEVGPNIAQSTVDAFGNGNAAKVTQKPRKRVATEDGETTQEGWPKKQKKSKGVENLTPQKFKGQITTKTTVEQVALEVADVDDIPDPAAPTGDQTVIEHEKVNDWRYEKRVTEEIIAENAEPLVGGLTDTWGVNSTAERLVPELVPDSEDPETMVPNTVPSGFGIKSARLAPLGNGKSIEEIERFPADSDGNGVIYTLEEEKTDDKTGIVIDIQKSLVNASMQKTLANAKRAAGWFPEVQSIDKWHSILVSSKVDMTQLPPSETWIEGGSFSLPNELQEVGVIWDAKKDKDKGAIGVNDDSYIEANGLRWEVYAEVTVNGSISGRPYTKIKAGKRGVGSVTVVRTYHNGPPQGSITPHSFQEVYGMLMISGESAVHMARGTQTGKGATRLLNSTNYRRNTDAFLVVHDFGPIVHSGNLQITHLGDSRFVSEQESANTGTLPGSGYYPAVNASINLEGMASLMLPTSGPVLGSGQSYVLDVNVSEWGFGVWVKEVYTITIP